MNILSRSAALVLFSTLLLTLTACVEQEPSMSLKGSVAFEGELEEAEEEGEEDKITCPQDVEPGSADEFYSRGFINIQHLRDVGQLGPPTGGATHPWFEFYAEVLNLLEESTQVGAGGGGGGNFQGLKADQNYIMITGATIRYPSDLNQFDGSQFAEALEKKEPFSMLLESSGGAALVSFPIIGPREIDALEEFHQSAVNAAFGGDYDPKAIIPLVAEIQIEGETFAGREVESNKFQFPIDVCADCEFGTTPTCHIVEK